MSHKAHSLVSPSDELARECPNSVWKRQRIEARNGFLKHKLTYQSGVINREELIAGLGVDTTAADLGTLKHHIREQAINTGKSVRELYVENNMEEDEFTESQLQSQADWIREQLSAASRGGVETKVVNMGINSGGSCDSWWIIDDTLTVEDLKSGRIEVKAYKKYSMMRYASGLLDGLGWSPEIKTVRLVISGIHFASSTYEIGVEELREWRDTELYEIVGSVFKDNPDTIAGEHCFMCSARRTCATALEMVRSRAKKVADVTKDTSIEELEDAYKAVVHMSKMKNMFRDELELRALDGEKLTTLTWKEGRKVSEYKVGVKDIESKILPILDNSILYKPRKLKTRAQLKKLYKHNEAVQKILSTTFKASLGAEQFNDALDGNTELVWAAPALRTKKQLQAIFANVPDALEVINNTEELEVQHLTKFIDRNIIIEEQPISIPRLRNLVGQEAIDPLIETTQTKHIG